MRSQATSQGAGTRLARSKHQIGTLYYNAKMNEIDLMEGKAQSMKTKSETQVRESGAGGGCRRCGSGAGGTGWSG